MKRFILSTFSVLLATGALAPTAQALPQTDSDFNLQTLRLSEFDSRNKSEDDQKPYYPYSQQQTPAQASSQSEWETTNWEANAEETGFIEADSTAVEESSEGVRIEGLSLIEQRHEVLDRD